jgi:S1-C subfamily serine protease
MRLSVAFLMLSAATQAAVAASPSEILADNSRSTVYLEVRNTDGGVVNRGSGFIVSHNGFVVTVAHMKVTPSQRLWAIIGQKAGTSFPLEFKDADEATDVAIWQFPQSTVCRPSVTLASKVPAVLDPVLALGFPGSSGLTPNTLTVTNLQTQRGFFKTDGFLEAGNSGGPVFNQSGQVVAIVHGGGLPGTENNEIIPITLAINLLRKWNVGIGIDAPVPYAETCYGSCQSPQHGIAGWNKEVPWERSSGWMGGGNNQRDVCNGLASAVRTEMKADEVLVTWTGEDPPKKDVFGHVEYKYHCRGVARIGPIYAIKRSAACGLWN